LGIFKTIGQRLKNLFLSLQTYDILSPDFQQRRQVNRALRDRPALSSHQWYRSYYQPSGIAPSVAAFAYSYLEKYSGLRIARVLPSDRLEADLHWTEVCWFDWETKLCDDFWHCFGIDISDRLEDFSPSTIADLIQFLNGQIQKKHSRNGSDSDIATRMKDEG
jgi:hypothetical protein